MARDTINSLQRYVDQGCIFRAILSSCGVDVLAFLCMEVNNRSMRISWSREKTDAAKR